MADVREVLQETEADREAEAKQREELADSLTEEMLSGDGLIEEAQKADDQEETEEPKESSEEPDYKALYEEMKGKYDQKNKRYIASSKESRRLLAENKKLKSEQAKAAAQVKEITEEELKKKYDDWDDMTSSEQKAIKRAEMAEARAAAAESMASRQTASDEYNEELEDWLELAEAEGKYIDVREQAEEFRKYARQNQGRDLDELAKIFTFDHPKQPTRKANLPFGNSGRKTNTGDKMKLTPSQEEHLRKTNFRKYADMVMKGEI